MHFNRIGYEMFEPAFNLNYISVSMNELTWYFEGNIDIEQTIESNMSTNLCIAYFIAIETASNVCMIVPFSTLYSGIEKKNMTILTMDKTNLCYII